MGRAMVSDEALVPCREPWAPGSRPGQGCGPGEEAGGCPAPRRVHWPVRCGCCCVSAQACSSRGADRHADFQAVRLQPHLQGVPPGLRQALDPCLTSFGADVVSPTAHLCRVKKKK